MKNLRMSKISTKNILKKIFKSKSEKKVKKKVTVKKVIKTKKVIKDKAKKTKKVIAKKKKKVSKKITPKPTKAKKLVKTTYEAMMNAIKILKGKFNFMAKPNPASYGFSAGEISFAAAIASKAKIMPGAKA